MKTLISFFPLVLMALAGVGFWAIGQFMRRRGWADRFDRIDTQVQRIQARFSGVFVPLGKGFFRAAQAISCAPIFGSKRSREMWASLEERAEEKKPGK